MITYRAPQLQGAGIPCGFPIRWWGAVAVPTHIAAIRTRLGQKNGGRTADGVAQFEVGEQDFLYCYVRAAFGAYTITSATFQLKSGVFPVAPPNGTVDYSWPSPVLAMTLTQSAVVTANHLLVTDGMEPSSYNGIFILTLEDIDQNVTVVTVEFSVVISVP